MRIKGKDKRLWFGSMEQFKEWEKKHPDHKGYADDHIHIKTGSVVSTDLDNLISVSDLIKTLAEIKEREVKR